MEAPTPAPAPAAPAQPAAPAAAPPAASPETISATRDAANRGDFSAFGKAHSASRQGAPLADVTATPATSAQPGDPAAPAPDAAAAPAPAADKPKSVRVTQEYINDRIRVAVESALREERARTTPARPEAPAAPAPPSEPEWKRYAAMPDAPKEENFADHAEFQAATAHFIASQMLAERDATAAQHAERSQLSAVEQQRVSAFVTELQAAKTDDPEFASKLSPEVRALKPFSALREGEPGTAYNVVAEQIYDTPQQARQVLLHLSQHPAELQRLVTVPEHLAALPPAQRAAEHIKFIGREFGKLLGRLEQSPAPAAEPPAPAPSPISAAPPPPPTITKPGTTSDPMRAAVQRGDAGTFLKLHRQDRAATRARR